MPDGAKDASTLGAIPMINIEHARYTAIDFMKGIDTSFTSLPYQV
jgi:hypothetical protein